MRLAPDGTGGLRIVLELDEAGMLDQLVSQLIQLLQSHSGTALDPDPLFASLEVGGSDELPEDPALARLLPDAYDDDDQSSEFRRVTEQGLINRKLQDAMEVSALLGPTSEGSDALEVTVSRAELPSWARTLTALRLAIAARVGLDTAEDHDRLAEEEDTRGTVLVFDWLAAILESVLAIMNAALLEHPDEGADAETGEPEAGEDPAPAD